MVNTTQFESARLICSTLKQNGFEAFLVGGSVRDHLLGKAPKDYDVVTSAIPTQVLSIFPTADSVGAHFGVILHKPTNIEIATYRSDQGIQDGRRPEFVQFETDVKKDLERRDFTINAFLMDPETDQIFDHLNGLADLMAKTIRAIGNPTLRFREDYLRMIRAVRFATKLGFSIHDDTLTAIRKNAAKITTISKERIKDEIFRSFDENPFLAFSLLLETHLLKHIIPEIPPEHYDILASTLFSINPDEALMAFTALLSLTEAKDALSVCRRLRLSSNETFFVVGVLDLQYQIKMMTLHIDRAFAKRLIRNKLFDSAMTLYRARVKSGLDGMVTNYGFVVAQKMTAEFIDSGIDLFPEKLITGDDLIALGMKPSRNFSTILTEIEDMQLRNEIYTRKQALDFVKRKHWRF